MIALIKSAIRLCTVFLFGSTGETISQKGGHLNLGIPGVMAMGVAGGALGSKIYLDAIGKAEVNPFLGFLIPLVFTLLFGALFGLFFSFLTVSLKTNQNVVGLIMTTFGVGLAILFIYSFKQVNFKRIAVCYSSLLSKEKTNLNIFEELFLDYGCLVYLSIIIALITAFILRKTRIGMNLTAVGENPAAADADGLNVNKYRYIATIVGCAIASLSGLFYFLDKSGGVDAVRSVESMEEFGWLAVALVIFSMWRTDLGIVGSIIFSLLYLLPSYFPGKSIAVNEFMKLLPYVVTVIVLIITSIFFKRQSQAPKGLGVNYFREDR